MRVLTGVLLALICGCGSSLFSSHVKEMDLMRGMAAQAAMSLKDGAVGQYTVSGQAINPGVQVEAAIKYSASAKYIGLAGGFGAAGQGELGAADKDAVYSIIQNASLSEAEWRNVLQEILKKIGEAATRPSD